MVLCFLVLHSITFAQVRGYQSYDLAGYRVYVQNYALSNYSRITQEAIQLLQNKLSEINRLNLSNSIKSKFQSVSFYMDWNKDSKGARYHPGRQWLIQNGYGAEKVKSVHISNINNFVTWNQQNQPYMILHELAHAYHDLVLSFNHSGILSAYRNAMHKGLYQNVWYNLGNGSKPYKQKAYATTNEREYFAEITEAFFGKNDYYPFNRSDLQSYDPQGYNLLVQIWGKQDINPQKSKLSRDKSVWNLHNYRNETIYVYWVDFQGREKHYATLKIRQKFAQNTFIGHLWRIKNARGQTIQEINIHKTYQTNYIR